MNLYNLRSLEKKSKKTIKYKIIIEGELLLNWKNNLCISQELLEINKIVIDFKSHHNSETIRMP